MQVAEQRAIYQMSLTPGMAFITGPEGRKAERDAIANDKDSSYRVIVNIVGRERQGKTSLRKLLSNDPFDEDEISTVGVDQELVDTTGIEPDPSHSWSKLDIRKANTDEYDEILGKHVMIRLGRNKNKATKDKFAPLILCGKIGTITMLLYYIFVVCIRSYSLIGWPWFSVVLYAMFGASTFVFGLTEGPSMAIGIRHLLILTDAWFRWDLSTWCLSQESLVNVALCFLGMLLAVNLLELCDSLSNGSSLGVGVTCFYCLCNPPQRELYLSTNPICVLDIHLFLYGCLFGLVLHHFRNIKVVSCFVLLLGVFIYIDLKFGFTIISAISLGVLHNVGLKLGQDMYAGVLERLNSKGWISSRRSRRLVRNLMGLLPGSFLTYFFGWKLSPSYFGLVVALALFLQIELIGYLKSKPQKCASKEASMKHPSKVISARTRSPRLKLVVRDFAGHPLYYDAHHVYMTGQCVYLLVFSLVDASKSFSTVYQDVLQWLQSIRLHNQYPETRVFIVGTHRDDSSLSSSKINYTGQKIKQMLPRSYHNMVVWNRDDTPLFPVENSDRNGHDCDHINLRSKITQEINTLIMREKFPVRFFFFFNLVEQYRTEGILYETFSIVYYRCAEMGLWLEGEAEFSQLLNFFNKMGEIMYRGESKSESNLIIFDPRGLLNILSHIISIPRISERASHLVVDWSVLEDHGICSTKLFDHVYQQYSQGVSKDCVLLALSRFNLICQIKTNLGTEISEDSFVIPSCLPDQLPYQERCWQVLPSDKVMYIKCVPHFPNSLFSRLLCVCVNFDRVDMKKDVLPNICKTKAVLTFKGKFCYQMELCEDEVSGMNELLKVSVREDGVLCESLVVDAIWTCLNQIVQYDFKMCVLTLGVLCPKPPPHEDGSKNHLLPITTSSNYDKDLTVPSQKEFWCCGRAVQLEPKQNKSTPCSSLIRRKKHQSNLRERPILELPNHVFTTICDFLNIPNPLGKDWTMLAGLVDLTAKDVDLINFKYPTNPCSGVLHTWCGHEGCVTLEALLEKLEIMERLDVIEELSEFGFDTN